MFYRLALALIALPLLAADSTPEIKLWPNGAPGSEGVTAKEMDEPINKDHNYRKIWNVHEPSITAFLPPKDKATGAAVIICPGGGHQFLAMHEGYDVGQWFADHGVAGFVLKYRLAKTEGFNYKVEVHSLQDAQRALRTVRARAAEWAVDPARVGLMGFSAGGAITWLAATKSDAGDATAADPVERFGSRPDFQILVYPGIRPEAAMDAPPATPPAFLICAFDDRGPVQALPILFQTLKKADVQSEIHIYARGGHGFGIRPRDGSSPHGTGSNSA